MSVPTCLMAGGHLRGKNNPAGWFCQEQTENSAVFVTFQMRRVFLVPNVFLLVKPFGWLAAMSNVR